MNQYFGNMPATILSYDAKARTARVHIPTITDGVTDGIIATFAYPIGDDDKDTERKIVENMDCYVFFQSGDPASPVIFASRSHGDGTVVDIRRIRQKNIELLADANIDLKAKTITMEADTINFLANTVNVDAKLNANQTTTIEGRPFMGHGHGNVQNGPGNSGGVV